jgi:Flp pilus assembly pilin Flp
MLHRIKKLKAIEQALFALLIAIAVISVWRGVKGLMDIYLFPNNYVLSSWISLAFGLLILAISHYWTKELA